ncbi:MAG: hypothetical protein AAF970_12845 [Bacteroidota bacterium]
MTTPAPASPSAGPAQAFEGARPSPLDALEAPATQASGLGGWVEAHPEAAWLASFALGVFLGVWLRR